MRLIRRKLELELKLRIKIRARFHPFIPVNPNLVRFLIVRLGLSLWLSLTLNLRPGLKPKLRLRLERLAGLAPFNAAAFLGLHFRVVCPLNAVCSSLGVWFKAEATQD